VELFRRKGFDTTRNAIIGQVHRAAWWKGLSRVKAPPKPYAPRRKPNANRKRPVVSDTHVIVKEQPLPLPPPVPLRTLPEKPPPQAPLGQPLYLSVVQIEHDQCRYWYGEGRGQAGREHETGFCGHPVSEGHRSWCEQHLMLVYAPGTKRSVSPWVEARPRMSNHIIPGRRTPA
jgi:hypothetical protein